MTRDDRQPPGGPPKASSARTQPLPTVTSPLAWGGEEDTVALPFPKEAAPPEALEFFIRETQGPKAARRLGWEELRAILKGARSAWVYEISTVEGGPWHLPKDYWSFKETPDGRINWIAFAGLPMLLKRPTWATIEITSEPAGIDWIPLVGSPRARAEFAQEVPAMRGASPADVTLEDFAPEGVEPARRESDEARAGVTEEGGGLRWWMRRRGAQEGARRLSLPQIVEAAQASMLHVEVAPSTEGPWMPLIAPWAYRHPTHGTRSFSDMSLLDTLQSWPADRDLQHTLMLDHDGQRLELPLKAMRGDGGLVLPWWIIRRQGRIGIKRFDELDQLPAANLIGDDPIEVTPHPRISGFTALKPREIRDDPPLLAASTWVLDEDTVIGGPGIEGATDPRRGAQEVAPSAAEKVASAATVASKRAGGVEVAAVADPVEVAPVAELSGARSPGSGAAARARGPAGRPSPRDAGRPARSSLGARPERSAEGPTSGVQAAQRGAEGPASGAQAARRGAEGPGERALGGAAPARFDRRHLDAQSLHARAWVWPEPPSPALMAAHAGSLALYGLFITARTQALWPLLFLAVVGGMLVLALGYPKLALGAGAREQAEDAVLSGASRRAFCLLVFMTAALHGLLMPYWYVSAPLELGLACAVAGTALSALAVAALAGPATGGARAIRLPGVRIMLDGALPIGIGTNALVAGLLGAAFVSRAGLEGPHRDAAALACAIGGLIGALRPWGALGALRVERGWARGPLDPAAWWFPERAAIAVSRAIPRLAPATRAATFGPLVMHPRGGRSRFGHLLTAALKTSRGAAGDALGVLALSPAAGSVAIDIGLPGIPKDPGARVAAALDAARRWLPEAQRAARAALGARADDDAADPRQTREARAIAARLSDLAHQSASAARDLGWAEHALDRVAAVARENLDALRAGGWTPDRLQDLDAPVAAAIDALQEPAWMGDERARGRGARLLDLATALAVMLVTAAAIGMIARGLAGL